MKKILLTRGKYAIVDDEDYEYLNQWKWYCSAYGYAVRDVGGRKNRRCIFMHRLINKTPGNSITDHIDRDKLNNSKRNLRSVTGSQNVFNRDLNKNNTSGHRGVIWRKDIEKWSARVKVNYKEIYLGCYKKLEDAINARKQGAELYHSI